MSDQEFEKGIILFIFTGVELTFNWLFMKCASAIWCRLSIGKWIWPKEVLAIDTECVGAGPRGNISMLARVSIVTRDYKVYDKYVKPTRPVTDYRTFVSGIRPINLINAEDYDKVRQEVAHLLKGCILVGHDLKNDLDSLNIYHPTEDIRDTSLHYFFKFVKMLNLAQKEMSKMNISPDDDCIDHLKEAIGKVKQKHPQIIKPSLKWLAQYFLNKDIQIGEHSSVEDAATAMNLYLLFEEDFETYLKNQKQKGDRQFWAT